MNSGYIYMIENNINHKKYIGQTKTPLEVRWKKHISNANTSKIGIAGAIHKYGVNNFTFKEIVKCDISELDELEKYYIKKYDTYYNGYNLTLGGEGTSYLDLDEKQVIDKYKELKYVKEVANYYNCCEKTISNILHKNNIEVKHTSKGGIKGIHKGPKREKPIRIVEINETFSSLLDCAKWLNESGFTKTDNIFSIQKCISRVLTGERKSYLKMTFEYIDSSESKCGR